MTEIQRYLAEEVAEDHADGIITRREAMRRLGLLGLGAGAATTLLTAFGGRRGAGERPPARRGGASPGMAPARVEGWARPSATQAITFRARAGRCRAPGRRRPSRAARCSSSTRTAA